MMLIKLYDLTFVKFKLNRKPGRWKQRTQLLFVFHVLSLTVKPHFLFTRRKSESFIFTGDFLKIYLKVVCGNKSSRIRIYSLAETKVFLPYTILFN